MTSDLEQRHRGERPDETVYSFGCYRLDVKRGELLHNSEPVALRPKTFDVLHYLLRQPKRVVSRDELFNAVWPNQEVSDDSLTHCLSEIRKALQDDRRQIVRTVPRRGYLIEADVQAAQNSLREAVQPVRQDNESHRKELPSRWTLWSVLILALAMLALWWRLEFQSGQASTTVSDWKPLPASLAVLPFDDASTTVDDEYLADGIAKDIRNLLSQSPDLTVIARNSSFSFRQSELSVGAIARKLGVEHVLEGSVQKIGNRVRVTARLIQGRTGGRLWSQTLEGRLGDEFAVQTNIARGVADFLGVELGRAGPANDVDGRTEIDYKARELFLQGKFFYARGLEGDVMRAQRDFEMALDLDPSFADAWVALAATLNLRRAAPRTSDEARLPGTVADEHMRYALERALALAPEHPEALWRIARLNLRYGEVEHAVAQMSRALELGWNNAMVQAMIGGFAHNSGYTDVAIPFSRRATILDPVNSSLLFNHALWLYTEGNLTAAEHAFRRVNELSPAKREAALAWLTWIRICQGDLDAASAFAEQLAEGPSRDQAEAILGHLRGDGLSADEALQRLLDGPKQAVADRLAFVYAMRGQPDEAFEWLSIATEELVNSEFGWRSERGNFVILQRSPLLRSLHADLRWNDWLVETEHLLRRDGDRRVVAVIRDYEARHPELYAPASLGLGPP